MNKRLNKTSFYENIRYIIEQARKKIVTTVNVAMVEAYWHIGRMIVEEEQAGKERAIYGDKLIPRLAEQLSVGFGKGFNRTSLAYMRQFYLIFYNYLLKCFVVINLKVGKLSHQDIGQLDFYVRYWEDHFKTEGDNPTIGIILCSEKNETIVRYSVLKNSEQLFASKYMLYLPTEVELSKELKREIEAIKLQRKLQKGDE